jgi:hypothetical protein
VHTDPELTDVVVFDVPSLSQARELVMRLDDQWACHAYEDSNITSVSVFISPTNDSELAPLLRTVEAWVTARSLGGIMFWIDGRGYLLRAHESATASLLGYERPVRP